MAEGLPVDEAIVVVGVCGAGKSTLVRGLKARGYPARICVQEHSYVPTLWRRRGRPRVLVYLHAGPAAVRRRLNAHWPETALAAQRERLAQAREQCDLYVDTDPLTADQVLGVVLDYLRATQRCSATRPAT